MLIRAAVVRQPAIRQVPPPVVSTSVKSNCQTSFRPVVGVVNAAFPSERYRSSGNRPVRKDYNRHRQPTRASQADRASRATRRQTRNPSAMRGGILETIGRLSRHAQLTSGHFKSGSGPGGAVVGQSVRAGLAGA